MKPMETAQAYNSMYNGCNPVLGEATDKMRDEIYCNDGQEVLSTSLLALAANASTVRIYPTNA